MTGCRRANRGSLISRRQFEWTALAACCGIPAAWGQQAQQPVQQVPWLAEIQQPPRILPPDAPKLPPILIDGEQKP
ncbi:MAG TPA: hypothetical protein VHV08_17080, partial [Pirellulales bacterium]|nr:hypothetical protein [Pirellulales bacterium]